MKIVHYLSVVVVGIVVVNAVLLGAFYTCRSGPFSEHTSKTVRILRHEEVPGSRVDEVRAGSYPVGVKKPAPQSISAADPKTLGADDRGDLGGARKGSRGSGNAEEAADAPDAAVEMDDAPRAPGSAGRAGEGAAAGAPAVDSAKRGGPPRRTAELVIAIPTIPRAGGRADYLLDALKSLEPQLLNNEERARVADDKVVTVVVMTSILPHASFETARAKYGSGPLSDSFVFKVNPREYKDPEPNKPEPHPNPRDEPGPQVRQQTLDVCGLLDAAKGLGRYVQIMEDDVTLCARGIEAILYAVSKADRYASSAPWTGLRMSYGMNGITLRDKDLDAFRDFMIKNLFLVPPDLLIIEWWAGKHGAEPYVTGRPHMVYRYNIYVHLGSVSTFKGRGHRNTPGCYVDYTGGLWPVERPAAQCRNDDISPCNGRPSGQAPSVTRFNR